jgi:LppX_LprAFG lipoprotein
VSSNVGHNVGMPRILRLIPFLALIALTLALAACGGSSLASDPGKVLKDAKLPPAGPNASTLKATFTPKAGAADGGGTTTQDSGALGQLGGLLGGPITIDATTQGDAATGVTADAKITAGPIDLPITARANKDNAWLQVNGEWYELGSPLGIDFSSVGGLMGTLPSAIKDPKATAVEDVDGVSCDRISGTIDPKAVGASGLTDQLQGLPIDPSALTAGKAEVSIWVARDTQVIRRIQINTAGSGDAATAGGLLLDLTVVPADAVVVQAPTGAKPIADLLTQLMGSGGLGGLLGGLGGLNLGQLGGALSGATA